MPEVSVKRFCGSCGTARNGTDPFCSRCGSPFNRPGAPTVAPVPAAALAEAWAQPDPNAPAASPQFHQPYTSPPFQPHQYQQVPHPSQYGVQGSHPGIDLSALTKPLRVGSRVAPVDMWLCLALAAVNVAILTWSVIDFLRVMRYLAFSYAGVALLEPVLLALVVGVIGLLYVWVGVGMLTRNPTSRWLMVVLGAVLALGFLLAGRSMHARGLSTVLIVVIVISNAAITALAALSPGIRRYVVPVHQDAPPVPVSVAAALTYFLALYLAINGMLLVVGFATASGSPYYGVPVWLLLVGVALLAAAVEVIVAGRQILRGKPLARIVITVAAPLAALLRFTTIQGSIEVDVGTWIQAGLAVATVVVLWLPAASAFFARTDRHSAPYSNR